jgi:hypothetical protein
MKDDRETVEMTLEELDTYVRMPFGPNYPPSGFLLADDVPLSSAALTVARLVAERDAALKDVDNLRVHINMQRSEMSTLHAELKFLRGGPYASPVKPRKWAVRDKADGCWLGEDGIGKSFLLDKGNRITFTSKREAKAFIEGYCKHTSCDPRHLKPVFVRIK